MIVNICQAHMPYVDVDAQADEVMDFAAQELRRYLARLLGKEVPGTVSQNAPAIRLELVEDPVLGHEGFEILADSRAVRIRGAAASSVLFGVYELLRECGGCCFSGPAPHGEHVPHRRSLDLTPLPVRRVPAMSIRSLQLYWRADLDVVLSRIDWMAKNGFNFLSYNVYDDSMTLQRAASFDPETGEARPETDTRFGESEFRRTLWPDLRKRGIKLDYFAHNLLNFLPPETYFEPHPEWYMQKGGERVALPAQLCLCTSNRDMIRQFVANVLEYAEAHPETAMIGIGPMDGFGWCECEACRAMDETPDDVFAPRKHPRCPEGENRSKARRYARFVNEVARAVKKAFPSTYVGYQGYVDLNFPPRGVQLESNVVAMTSTYWRCGAHSIAPGTCPANSFFFDTIRQWRESHQGKLVVGDNAYMGMHCQKALPYPIDEVICEDWARFKAMGMDGDFAQLNDASFKVYALNFFALGRSCWQDDVDTEALLDEFLLGMFGAAGKALRPIFSSFRATIRRMREQGKAFSVFLRESPVKPPEKLEACLEPSAANIACFLDELGETTLDLCVEQALATASSEREKIQVQEFASAVEYWRRAAACYRAYWPLAIHEGPPSKQHCSALQQSRDACVRVLDYVETCPVRGRGWMHAGESRRWERLLSDVDKKLAGLAGDDASGRET